MRTENSIRNTTLSFITNIFTVIIGIIAQKIFINVLGSKYLGINGLFTNIISMLSIVELGIGSAIIYNLYRPIKENDTKKIKALMSLYKKCYMIIALIILIIGLSITPFLNIFVTDVDIDINLQLVYILFLIDIVASYILSYKRSIIIANQKSYIINIIHIIYLVALNTFQIVILLLSKNYYLYLIIKIIMRLLENILITIKSDKMYPYLKNLKDSSCDIDEETKQDITKKVKALFFHKLGSFFILGTDNIIISKFLGVVTVGLYSNYYLIINAVKTIFATIINALTPSIGNLLIEENTKKNYQVFKKVRFLNFFIAATSSISLLIIMDSFITIWIGSKYLLSKFVLVVLVISYFNTSMRNSYMAFKEAKGIYFEDRFCPLIESVTNIIASIILLKYFGLAGVFMGTIISSLVLWCYSYPKYVYKNLFNRSYINYILETISYILLFIVVSCISYYISELVSFDNIYLNFISKCLVSLIVPNVLLVMIFFKTDNFKYYLNLIKSIKKKVIK